MVLAFAFPAAAVAQSETVQDKVKDAVLIHFTHCDPAGFGCHRHRRADHRNRIADVVSATHVFDQHALTLTMKVRGMTSDKRWATYVGWEIWAPRREGWSTQILYSRGHASLDLIPIKSHHTCPTAGAHVGRKHHVYRLTIPASCLGTAAWVRVSESTMVVNRSGSRSSYDDPRQGSELKVRSGVAQEKWGPRLYRGHRTR